MSETAEFLAEAVRLAEAGMHAGDGGPFGAVIVRQGQIVACGWNRVLAQQDPTAHAEVVAIRAACRTLGRFHLEDCELYSSCEPCPMCLGAILWARIPLLAYAATRADAAAAGFDDAGFYEELRRPPEARQLRCRHLPLPAAAALLRQWPQLPGHRPY